MNVRIRVKLDGSMMWRPIRCTTDRREMLRFNRREEETAIAALFHSELK
jgi:hypothetical protein